MLIYWMGIDYRPCHYTRNSLQSFLCNLIWIIAHTLNLHLFIMIILICYHRWYNQYHWFISNRSWLYGLRSLTRLLSRIFHFFLQNLYYYSQVHCICKSIYRFNIYLKICIYLIVQLIVKTVTSISDEMLSY